MAYDGVAVRLPDVRTHLRLIAEMLNIRVNRGKINVTTTITLAVSATTTTLIDERLGSGSYVDFMPITANAAAAKSSIYVTGQTKGQCTINHASSANADQTFTVLILA